MRNIQLKERFLTESSLVESTQRTYKYLLERSSESEEDFDRDIYEFTPRQCDDLLYSFQARSEGMVFVIITCFKQYLDFCKVNNLIKDDFNYFATITGLDTVLKYVDKNAMQNKYITYEELIEMEDMCLNPQDAVIPELLFLGVKGETSKDLLGLKINNVVEYVDNQEVKYKIILADRQIDITERSYNIIKEAHEQKEYFKANGEDSNSNSQTLSMLESDYILKPAGRDGGLKHSSLQARFIKIKEYFGNKYLSIGSLFWSGVIHLAKQIKSEKSELEKNDWIAINKQYGMPEDSWRITKSKIERLL